MTATVENVLYRFRRRKQAEYSHTGPGVPMPGFPDMPAGFGQPTVELLTCQDETLGIFASGVARAFASLEFPCFVDIDNAGDRLARSLLQFLKFACSLTGPRAIAFVDRKERYVPPILEVFVLWSRAISLSKDEEVRTIKQQHSLHIGSFDECFDSFIRIIDPRQFGSPESLLEELSSPSKTSATYKIIACAEIRK